MWRSCIKYAKCTDTVPQLKFMQLICAGECVIPKLQRNWYISRSCTPAATCEAHAVIKNLNIETLSITLPTHRKSPYSEATVKQIRSAGARGGAEIAVTM
ncbi:hypothetical protein EVAR_23004_1 [Eumeta japonica]|uniref:Uncharacterized protein n=1 Tax=Eumeta variegata TaxID=151549 RepID=A0A4C1UQC9_EUMVA|nr:hypothetical protein EVAR_23004_1 [Eumeta japonica]